MAGFQRVGEHDTGAGGKLELKPFPPVAEKKPDPESKDQVLDKRAYADLSDTTVDGLKARLKNIEFQMTQAELYANYWMAMATSGAAALQDIRVGERDGTLRRKTPEELTKDACETALAHIQSRQDLIDSYNHVNVELHRRR